MEIPAELETSFGTNEKVVKSLKVNIVGEHSTIASELGLTTGTGRVNKWMSSSGGTLLPSLTIATPTNIGSTFNSKLKGGNASADEWVDWAGEGQPVYGIKRGYYAHSGISQFLEVVNGAEKDFSNFEVLKVIHGIFIEEITSFKEEFSDAAFSATAFNTYDRVLLEYFSDNIEICESYRSEKIAISAARTSPRPRPLVPSKNMGGTIYNITNNVSLLPYYNKIKKIQWEKTGVKATESHIFSEDFLSTLSSSSNLIVTKP